jgi:AraC-like DNA-binding protein
MTYTYEGQEMGSFLGMSTDYPGEMERSPERKNLIYIIWNRTDQEAIVIVDEIPHTLKPGQVTTTTYLQHVDFPENSPELTTFCFNREFYCIQDHDYEVSCNGILFMGTQETPVVTLGEEAKKIETLLEVFIDEFRTRDNIQGEMLRMMLKRLIIKITRLAREQLVPKELKESQVDTIRKFNVLVDLHYREKRQVSEYAEMLFKSPKTLSNLFAKYNQKSPLQIIQERIVLEVKRLLIYTDKSVKEIAYDLGFDDTGSFFKLFRKFTSMTPQEFKMQFKK